MLIEYHGAKRMTPLTGKMQARSQGPDKKQTTNTEHTKSRRRHQSRRKLFMTSICILLVSAIIGIIAVGYIIKRESEALGALNLARAENVSASVVDRKGRLLRAFTTPNGRWRLPIKAANVDQRYLSLLFTFEDKRFYRHGGIDYLAMLRAIGQAALHGRIVSGGSTLTMQVARLLEGRHNRTVFDKLRQMIRARQLEARFNKTEILNLYLKLAPFGGNIEGVRAASFTYFGKEPRRLSLGEAALLVALPQSPENRRPDRFTEAARAARRHVLERALNTGLINSAEFTRASAEPIPVKRLAFPKWATHESEREIARHPHRTIHHLTLDAPLQARLEDLVAQHAEQQGKKLSAALMVVENATGHVLARIGSADYFDKSRFGAIDMTRAVRSPGSALKPIVYGLGFELGLIHPETLIDDKPARFGTYRPKNFDKIYRGALSIREALQKSLNIPAVKVLAAVGPDRMIGRLRQAGVTADLPEGALPSLAIALGGLGVRIEDMARIYVALARGGEPIPLITRMPTKQDILQKTNSNNKLLDAVATAYVTSILKDAPPPDNAKRGAIAYKTGTSYGYRDAWAAGYDGRHTIIAWIGRPDAAATPGLTGRTAAAPLLFDAFQRISPRRAQLAQLPRQALATSGTNLPEPLKRFERERQTFGSGPYLQRPLRIAFPPDRSEIELSDAPMPVVFKADGGTLPLSWFANGRPIGQTERERHLIWQQAKAGFIRLSVVDSQGRTDWVTVRLRSMD